MRNKIWICALLHYQHNQKGRLKLQTSTRRVKTVPQMLHAIKKSMTLLKCTVRLYLQLASLQTKKALSSDNQTYNVASNGLIATVYFEHIIISFFIIYIFCTFVLVLLSNYNFELFQMLVYWTIINMILEKQFI